MSGPGANAAARAAALQALASSTAEPTSSVAYESTGRLLITGPAGRCLEASRHLPPTLNCSLLVQGTPSEATVDSTAAVQFTDGRSIGLQGHLGAFDLWLESGDGSRVACRPGGQASFDLVLDLGEVPLVDVEVPPFGYEAPGPDPDGVLAALERLGELVGEFRKARFFAYDPDICARARSGVQGCRRCLDACPTAAISSLAETIQVDPHLCQGAGSCATACPSGAIIYAHPRPRDTLDRLRRMLAAYREAGGTEPVVLLYGQGDAGDGWQELEGLLPPSVLPFPLEELGSAGVEVWLGALAYGAVSLALMGGDGVPPSVQRELQEQIATAGAILAALGYPAGAVSLIETGPAALATAVATLPAMPGLTPATHAGLNDKRRSLLLAVEHLRSQAELAPAEAELPPQAPLGEVRVDRQACTLCMACASLCPAGALLAGGDTPRLDFLEVNCVQCGICRNGCPESAITLRPRLLFDRAERESPRVLHQEEAFRCVVCGTPFATRKVIDRVLSQLEGHPMFAEPSARRRLEMCEECRVKDMFAASQ
jgi:ferredoxin